MTVAASAPAPAAASPSSPPRPSSSLAASRAADAVAAAGASASAWRGALRDILGYGLASGILIAVLTLTEYRFLVVEHSLAIYGVLIATLFAGVGVWLGRTVARQRADAHADSAATAASACAFASASVHASPPLPETSAAAAPGLTPRELEVLLLIAGGLSNRQIAAQLRVSEHTVKTHSSRVFGKLGAKRRTQAVSIAQAAGLIPSHPPTSPDLIPNARRGACVTRVRGQPAVRPSSNG